MTSKKTKIYIDEQGSCQSDKVQKENQKQSRLNNTFLSACAVFTNDKLKAVMTGSLLFRAQGKA